jgi:hypothetical protein
MIEEPEADLEEMKRHFLLKRFDITMKECHAIMKVGWEADK